MMDAGMWRGMTTGWMCSTAELVYAPARSSGTGREDVIGNPSGPGGAQNTGFCKIIWLQRKNVEPRKMNSQSPPPPSEPAAKKKTSFTPKIIGRKS